MEERNPKKVVGGNPNSSSGGKKKGGHSLEKYYRKKKNRESFSWESMWNGNQINRKNLKMVNNRIKHQKKGGKGIPETNK